MMNECCENNWLTKQNKKISSRGERENLEMKATVSWSFPESGCRGLPTNIPPMRVHNNFAQAFLFITK